MALDLAAASIVAAGVVAAVGSAPEEPAAPVQLLLDEPVHLALGDSVRPAVLQCTQPALADQGEHLRRRAVEDRPRPRVGCKVSIMASLPMTGAVRASGSPGSRLARVPGERQTAGSGGPTRPDLFLRFLGRIAAFLDRKREQGIDRLKQQSARRACAVWARTLWLQAKFASAYTNSTSAWCRNFGIGRLPPTHIDTTIGTMSFRRAISLSVKPQIRVASKAAGRRRTRSGKMVVSAGVAMS